MRNHTVRQIGFSLVEVILAVAMLGLIVTALVGAMIYSMQSSFAASHRIQALFFADEGLEAARHLKMTNFANLTPGTFGLGVQNNKYMFFGSSDAKDIFTRSITITTVDASTTAVTSLVSWDQNPFDQGNIALSSRFTDWNR